jgi:SAM-dependent methyltransferase
MTDSPFSPYANLHELDYRDRVQRHEASAASMVSKVRASGRLQLLPYLRARNLVVPRGAILEIGAGSAWLSAELSKIDAVSSVTAVDFSDWLVSEIMPVVFAELGADVGKIERRRGDFHDLSGFGPARFDWVFADSALHHATDVTRVLREVAAVLKQGGSLVALREPVKPLLAGRIQQSRAEVEKALQEHGVPEPLYSRREWDQFFAGSGLDLRWHPVVLSSGLRGAAGRLLNGITKADYCLIGTRPA